MPTRISGPDVSKWSIDLYCSGIYRPVQTRELGCATRHRYYAKDVQVYSSTRGGCFAVSCPTCDKVLALGLNEVPQHVQKAVLKEDAPDPDPEITTDAVEKWKKKFTCDDENCGHKVTLKAGDIVYSDDYRSAGHVLLFRCPSCRGINFIDGEVPIFIHEDAKDRAIHTAWIHSYSNH